MGWAKGLFAKGSVVVVLMQSHPSRPPPSVCTPPPAAALVPSRGGMLLGFDEVCCLQRRVDLRVEFRADAARCIIFDLLGGEKMPRWRVGAVTGVAVGEASVAGCSLRRWVGQARGSVTLGHMFQLMPRVRSWLRSSCRSILAAGPATRSHACTGRCFAPARASAG